MLNVVNRGRERTLGQINDAVAHLLRVQAGVVPKNADYRNINVGEDVRRSAVNNNWTQYKKKDGDNHKRIRSSKCQPNNPHKGILVLLSALAAESPRADKKTLG